MSERGDIEFLGDISEAIRRLEFYTQKMDYADFLEDTKTQDAVIRNLEILGEAVKNISDELKEKHTEILWKDIAGLRDKLIHHYFGVNLEIVWTIIEEDLPKLKKELQHIPGGK